MDKKRKAEEKAKRRKERRLAIENGQPYGTSGMLEAEELANDTETSDDAQPESSGDGSDAADNRN